MTRSIVVMASMSLDGFMAGPNGELDWQLVDDELHAHFNQVSAGMSAFLEGRVMYELMERAWPDADKDPSSTAPMREFAGIWRQMPKVVYSRTLSAVGPNATLVREVVPEEVLALKAQPGGDMALGGADIAAAFLRLGLVDQYRVYVHPVLLGAGKPLFPPSVSHIRLALEETRRFTNGVVLLRYAVA